LAESGIAFTFIPESAFGEVPLDNINRQEILP